MKTLQTIFSGDKERFLQQISRCETMKQAEQVCEDELSRILSMYNDQELSEPVQKAALQMMQTARMCLALIGTEGQTKIYSRNEYGAKKEKENRSVWFYIFFVLASGCAIASAVVLILFASSLLKSFNTIAGICLAVAAMVCFFIAGALVHRKETEQKQDLYAESRPDGEKIYHTLLAVFAACDNSIDEMQKEEIIEQKKKLLSQEEILDKRQLELLGQMLENAYAESGSDFAREVISDIKFYLHKQKIELEDYSSEHKARVDMMPSAKSGTIRPAFVIDGTLLKKGLAAGGR